jgi:hypothetical protein
MKRLLLATVAAVAVLAMTEAATAAPKQTCLDQMVVNSNSAYIQRGRGDDLCQFDPVSVSGKKILSVCKPGDTCKAVVMFRRCTGKEDICGGDNQNRKSRRSLDHLIHN